MKEEDGSVTFSCQFCKPNGKLRWLGFQKKLFYLIDMFISFYNLRYKNKQEIFHGFKYHVEVDGADYRLVINKLNPDDEGKYVCKINDIDTFAYLTVERKKT